jgi:hypothetical protein
MAVSARRRPMDTTSRFLDWVSPEPMSGCWLWTGSLANGYPSMCVDGKIEKMHRWSYEKYNGPLAGVHELVRHMCHNPACVNPGHLRKGTQSQNLRDSVEAGRWGGKLSEDDVRGILADYKPFEFGLLRCAKKYGCSKRNILDIVKGRKFKHITVPGYNNETC